MKTLRNFSCLILVVIAISSCQPPPPALDIYALVLCFQDASGNNILEDIESEQLCIDEGTVNPELYSLDIILQNYINGETVPGPDIYPQTVPLQTRENNQLGTCLSIYITRLRKKNNVRKLTYKLKCPYVFGDEEIHEIVAYWNLHELHAECYRIEFEGQEITPQLINGGFNSLAIIKLDGVREKP